MNFTHIHKTILDCMSEAVYVIDRDMKILYTNPAARELTEYPPEETIGNKCHNIFCESSYRCENLCPPKKAMREKAPILHREAETKTKSGLIKQTQISISPFFEDEVCVGAVIVIKDITELKKAEERIRYQNEFLTSVINSLPHPFYVIDANTYEVQMANTAALTGPLPENSTCHMLSHDQTSPCSGEDHPCPLEVVKKSRRAASMEHVHINAEGIKQNVEVHCYPVFDAHGNLIQLIEYCIDISERKVFEERMKQMAFFDNLTGIPNRALFFDRLGHSISLAKRNRQTLALLFLDLDRFKLVNDNFGHNTGDLLLKEIAVRLKNSLRQSDTAARIGGDEFTVILSPIASPHDARRFAGKILKILAEPFHISGHDFIISASIGISLYPDDGDDTEILLKKADSAMYIAKEQRNNTFRFYSPQ